MDYEIVRKGIEKAILKNPADVSAYEDMFSLFKDYDRVNHSKAHERNRDFQTAIRNGLNKTLGEGDFDVADKFSNLLFRSLVFDAPFYFDAYLQAVEYGKPLDKKFYLPRRHYLKRYVDAYQKILDGELDFLSISMPKRSGKALTLDTDIPTPFGFRKMRDIKVGDLVIAKDGYDTKVTDVFPQGKVDVYKVKFSDGSEVKTCANHLWTVKVHNPNVPSGHNGYSVQTLTTGDMLKHGVKSTGKNAHNIYAVEYCKPVEFMYQEVELDPYVLGVILGDGTVRGTTVMITSFDHEVMDYVSTHLPEGDIAYCQDEKKGRWVIKSKERRCDEHGYLLSSRTREILANLGIAETLSYQKFIPAEYLFTTSVMREEVLAGLLDTDGYADAHQIEYATTSPALRDNVMFLVKSLGGRATCKERMGSYKKNGEVIKTRVNYRITIMFPKGINPFKIERKRAAFKPAKDTLYHYIESIEYAGKEEAQCICVDNEEHLYLCTRDFIPTHNSQLGINFTAMLSGKYPDRSTLMEGTGDDLVKSFYLGILEYIQQPNDYHFYDIFPESKLVQTNADTKTLNLLHKSRFPTVMCRSIDARQVGLSEATNLLYLDDCVEGREEAKNRQRLDDKWEVISGDIIGRAIEGTPIVICGTRYSLYDPIGHLQEEMKRQGKRMCVIETPALDPVTDESNFEYEREGRKVFTTQYFRDQREMLSAEQWESEFQQQPFEAKGILFPERELNRFFELPIDRDPDSVIAVCDTADKGEDYCAMPIAAVYGDEVYVVDVVFDDAPPEVTKPECAKKLMEHKVVACTFESNNAGSYFARDVEKLIQDAGGKCSVRTKRTISNKQTRIEFASDNILKNFYFLDSSKYSRNSQYAEFMKQVITYTRSGKVPHDDAPDSLSLLENELRGLVGAKVEVMKRPC